MLRNWFEDFYGSGFESVVFQTLRERQGLCYSAYAALITPPLPWRNHYLALFTSIQADKLEAALNAVDALGLPADAAAIEHARQSGVNAWRSERLTPRQLLNQAEFCRKNELPGNYRQLAFDELAQAEPVALTGFMRQYLPERYQTVIVVGDQLPEEQLKQFGKLTVLTPDDIFRD